MKAKYFGNRSPLIRFCLLVFVSLLGLMTGSCSSLVGFGMNALQSAVSDAPQLTTLETYTLTQEQTDFKLELAQDGQKVNYLVLSSNLVPGVKIYGLWQPEHNQAELTKWYGFANWPGGWSEFEESLTGQLYVSFGEGLVSIKTKDAIQKLELIKGRIRLGNTIFSQERSLGLLSLRRTRVLALVEYMQSAEHAPNDSQSKEFRDYWTTYLLPELSQAGKAGKTVYAEGVNWHSDYSAEILPQHLAQLRDQGGILRDWQEAYDWLLAEYSWPTFLAVLDQGLSLNLLTKHQ